MKSSSSSSSSCYLSCEIIRIEHWRRSQSIDHEHEYEYEKQKKKKTPGSVNTKALTTVPWQTQTAMHQP